MKLIIEDDEGRKTVVQLGRDEITIGRQDGNIVQLAERNVSRRHARLVRNNGLLLIEDLRSYNGVHVNGDRIAGPTRIKEGDLIEIGDYDLGLEGKIEAVAGSPQVAASAQRATPLTMPPPPPPPAAEDAAEPDPSQLAQTRSPSAGGATAIIRITDLTAAPPQPEARDLQKAEMPRLVGLGGAIRGKEFYLTRTDVKVGRSEDNDVAIDHPSMSRQHARFVLEDGAWKVIDDKSANGVHVNGELYAISGVRPGDTIELGHLKFRFCAPGDGFALPSEPNEDPRPAPRPSGAELAAPARTEPPGPPARTRIPARAIAVAATAVLLVLGALFLARRTGQSASIKAALAQGDAALKRHDYLQATEFYEEAAASGETSPNMRKAADEARAQEAHQQLDRAIAASDFDRAKLLEEKCAADASFWCRKAQEKGEAVRQGYARAHLAKALKAKGSKPELCRDEVQLVLAFDAGNTEAQALAGQCAPAAVVAAVQREAQKPRGPSQKDRDARAKQLITDGNSLSTAKEYGAAIVKYQAALETKPSGQYVGLAYRGLGTAAAYQSDTNAAVRWFKLYLPFAPDEATKTQVTQLIQRFGGATEPQLAR
jgi:pSer/pThr/pTyr-binding forkhead associated (FHA) protein/tetratricopeptide (TPR) repeat protein